MRPGRKAECAGGNMLPEAQCAQAEQCLWRSVCGQSGARGIVCSGKAVPEPLCVGATCCPRVFGHLCSRRELPEAQYASVASSRSPLCPSTLLPHSPLCPSTLRLWHCFAWAHYALVAEHTVPHAMPCMSNVYLKHDLAHTHRASAIPLPEHMHATTGCN